MDFTKPFPVLINFSKAGNSENLCTSMAYVPMVEEERSPLRIATYIGPECVTASGLLSPPSLLNYLHKQREYIYFFQVLRNHDSVILHGSLGTFILVLEN